MIKSRSEYDLSCITYYIYIVIVLVDACRKWKVFFAMSSYVNYIKTSKKHIKKLLVFCTPFFHMSITFYTFCQSDMFEVLVVPGGPAKCLYITYSHLAGPPGTTRNSQNPFPSQLLVVPRWSLLLSGGPFVMMSHSIFYNFRGSGFFIRCNR